MKTVPSMKLSQEGCDVIVNAAIEKAKELKQVVSICVVDAGAHLMAFKRMTNGRTHNTLIAQAKARCAASPPLRPVKKAAMAARFPITRCWHKHSPSGPAGSSVSKAVCPSPSKASASAVSDAAARQRPSTDRSSRPASTRLIRLSF